MGTELNLFYKLLLNINLDNNIFRPHLQEPRKTAAAKVKFEQIVASHKFDLLAIN